LISHKTSGKAMKEKRVMIRRSNRVTILSKTIVPTFLMLLTATVLWAQEERTPARGYQAGNSYSFSDLENVNLTNGNLMLNIPLAALTGRGSGGGVQVTLRYNSKLWDTMREDRSDGTPVPDVPGAGYDYSRDLLRKGEYAGWKLDSGLYTLVVRNRQDQEPERPCLGPSSGGEAGFVQNGFMWRVEMRLPDGSIKEFRPYGTGYSYNDLYNNGYFEINLNGDRKHYSYSNGHPACNTPTENVTNTGMNYYSADGSGMRLYVPHDANEHWTLYQPDGTKIENLPTDETSLIQRQTDRNQNTIKWKNGTAGSYSGTKIENDAGQFVLITNNGVVQPGVNGELLVTTINWGQVWINRKYRATYAINANQEYLYDEILDDLDVVTSITLPENLGQYNFTYNGTETKPSEGNYTAGFGELKSVELPSTAKAVYEYKLDDSKLIPSSCSSWTGCAFAEDGQILYNSVTKRDLTYDLEYDGSSAETTETTLYEIDGLTGNSTITRPDGSVTSQTGSGLGVGPGYARSGTVSDGTITEKLWAQNKAPKVTGNQDSFHITAVNAYVKTEFTSIKDAGGNYTLTAIKDYDYDKNGNLLEIREYDWVPYGDVVRNPYPSAIPASAVLKRKTVNTYYNPTPVAADWATDSPNHYANPSSPKLHNVIKSTEIQDGGGNIRARSEFFYDSGSSSPDKGNLTQTRVWDNTLGALASPDGNGSRLNSANAILTSAVYDPYGNVISSTDAKGNITQVTYALASGPNGYVPGLYPTQVITAYGTSVARTSASTYDFYTGRVLTATDVDNSLTNASEYDKLGRPVKSITAQGTALESWVRTEYHDAERFVVIRGDLETKGDGKKVATKFLDQLGRTRLAKTLEDAATQSATNETDGIKVQTRYSCDNPASPADSNGTYALNSNPYRAATSSAASGEQAMGWSLGYSDKTGRHSEAATFSGAALPAPWGSSTAGTGTVKTDTSAERTLVTDQSGKQRLSRVNALGQLTDIWEITAQDSATVSVTFPSQSFGYGYQTGYLYDTLGNLITVDQGGQTRSFAYNSLSLLTTAQNPESGTISYIYEKNGNLKEKSQLRSGTANVVTAYSYDELNRVTQRSYTTPNGTPSNYQTTPTVSYTYDDPNIARSKGKLTKVSSSVSTTEYMAFDLLGRVTAHKQTTGGTAYTTGYIYNLSGALIEETYPSGRKIRNTLDADGDLAQVESKKNASAGYWTYASGFTYNAAGAATSIQLGNGHWESMQFNARLQPTQIALGVTPAGTSLLKLNYSYGTTQNNGNVESQTITVPTVSGSAGFTATQSYTYDQLNRLYDAAETVSGSQTWKQTFSYDRFGNRRFDTQANRTTTLEANCPAAVCNPEINQATNRLLGTTYDSAGNTTVDGGSQQYVYDGENKMVQAKDASGTTLGLYSYDGNGKRIKKETAAEITVFVYDATGKTVAEYSTQLSSEPQVAYLTSDALGTPRVNTNAGGAVIARHDYHPFGEEISTSQRTSAVGYDTDDIRKKFTGYERDIETDLDYAGARYYGKSLGRFTTPDPMMASGAADEPQTWNRYAYVDNNPLVFVDITGELKRRKKDGKLDYKFYGSGTMSNSGTTFQAMIGFLQTDNGVRIQADFNLDGDRSGDANCHGLTFGDGEFSIDNKQIATLIENDGYHEVSESAAQAGDVVVYEEAVYATKGDDKGTIKEWRVVHSATVVETEGGVQVAGINGTQMKSTTTAKDQAWTPSSNPVTGKPAQVRSTIYNKPRSAEEIRANVERAKNYDKSGNNLKNRTQRSKDFKEEKPPGTPR
jgi:RHS repeat-associated protein